MTTPNRRGAKGQNGGGRKPVSSETRDRIIALARPGNMSQAAVAREAGVSRGTVAKVCREADPPITFDRSMTAAAVEAHSLDMKAERAKIAEKAVGEVHRLFGLLTSPHEVTHWDKEGIMHRGTISLPTSGDVRNYATAIGILTDKHLVLVRHDSDDRDRPAVEMFLNAVLGRSAS